MTEMYHKFNLCHTGRGFLTFIVILYSWNIMQYYSLILEARQVLSILATYIHFMISLLQYQIIFTSVSFFFSKTDILFFVNYKQK